MPKLAEIQQLCGLEAAETVESDIAIISHPSPEIVEEFRGNIGILTHRWVHG